ncbi:hypothetical protein [Sansalvadorimonas verongulae]|uniref:hypothetical protein n=1 Tax=Sansalvadorimonas verongulae TaxID=2172824 RepID=UPI0012BCC03E|nr:hypothetical protein [Sansalvadorimonas verongulae]MTI13189.1 hypothetical protein [Sansalvadorimonas verongulae]
MAGCNAGSLTEDSPHINEAMFKKFVATVTLLATSSLTMAASTQHGFAGNLTIDDLTSYTCRDAMRDLSTGLDKPEAILSVIAPLSPAQYTLSVEKGYDPVKIYNAISYATGYVCAGSPDGVFAAGILTAAESIAESPELIPSGSSRWNESRWESIHLVK